MIESVIETREAVISPAMKVRRILPFRAKRNVGPFVFLDHMGPAHLAAGAAADVLPHPHIGLATVTYLFEGAFLHRDSLGTEQEILPGDVNWMTAGRGIVHSERIPPRLKQSGLELHGLQAWVALPLDHEDDAPTFQHHEASSLPTHTDEGARYRVVAGRAFGKTSPVKTLSELFYVSAEIPKGGMLRFDPDGREAALYLVSGSLSGGGALFASPVLLTFKPGHKVELKAEADTRAMLLGGAPLDAPRFIHWNFVSSSKEKIEAAKTLWREQGFPKVPGETEFVPLPS